MRARNALVLAVSLVIAEAIGGGALASGGKMTKAEIVAADYRIEPKGYRPLAIGGSGGMFSVMPEGRILLIDSDEPFGIVASDFNELETSNYR